MNFPQFILQVKKFNAYKVKWATSHHRWAVECGRFGLSWLFQSRPDRRLRRPGV